MKKYRTIPLLLCLLLSGCTALTACGGTSSEQQMMTFTQSANSSSGSYWEYELSTDTILVETDYHESKSPLNFGPGYTQHWTFEIMNAGEVTIHWLAYEGDSYKESDSYSTTYVFDADGNYDIIPNETAAPSSITETTEETTDQPETTASTEAPAETTEPSPDAADWRSAYLAAAADYEQYMADISVEYELDKPRVGSYDLVYVDDDEIPELIVTAKDIDLGGKLYTWIDGEAVPVYEWFGIRADSFYGYEPYSGRFWTSGSGGAAYTIFQEFQMENGTAVLTESIRTDNISPDSDEIGYFLNDELVSDAVGEERMNYYLDRGHHWGNLSYDALHKRLTAPVYSDWQDAYSHAVEDFELWLKEEIGMEESDAAYSLIYIDDDDTPELLIDSYAMQELYTFLHGSVITLNTSASYRSEHFSGYQEKSGQYWIYNSAGSDNWYLTIMELKNGNAANVETLGCDSALQNEYHLGYKQITKEEAEQKLSEYRALETEYETFDCAEMLGILTE